MRFFNTAGPVRCEEHYCLPPLERLSPGDILSLIGQKKYFVLHAPRQTGKTSCLLALMEYLNSREEYRCVYCNVEAAQAARENVEEGMKAILSELASRSKYHLDDDFVEKSWSEIFNKGGPFAALNGVLTSWSAQNPNPLVVLIDEIDSLVGDTLISVLRQLRAGYDRRPSHFPQSVILCGVRDVRDYRIHSELQKEIITGGSAFNIKAESLRLGDFSFEDLREIYSQHMEETGQAFAPGVLERIWDFTEGQPWLINALGYEVCFRIPEGRDRSKNIPLDLVEQAKESLILRRETHLDQLADKLKEDRVRRVIEPLLRGVTVLSDIPEDDLQYVTDLGLIRRKPQVTISNPIYREIIPRMLTASTQDMIPVQTAWYVDAEGRLDMAKLLIAFQEFFREHSEHWIERFDYKEAGPQLLLQAFLQRIVNAGGRIEREYGLGRMRTDLLVKWEIRRTEDAARGAGWAAPTGGDKVQKVVIELKVLHKSLEKTLSEGLDQTVKYMDRCGTDDGHLVIFDRMPDRTWEEKIFHRREEHSGKIVQVWGM